MALCTCTLWAELAGLSLTWSQTFSLDRLTQVNLTLLYANNKWCRKACASKQSDRVFAFPYLESILVKLAPCIILIFYLVSEAEQIGLSLTQSVLTLKTGFLPTRLIPLKYPIDPGIQTD